MFIYCGFMEFKCQMDLVFKGMISKVLPKMFLNHINFGWSLTIQRVYIYIPWASTTIKIMVDPIWMIKTLRVQQWWLYFSTHCFNGGWNPRVYIYILYKPLPFFEYTDLKIMILTLLVFMGEKSKAKDSVLGKPMTWNWAHGGYMWIWSISLLKSKKIVVIICYPPTVAMKSDETVTRGDLPTCQPACKCRLVMRRLRLWTVETTRSKYPTLVVSTGVVVGFYLVFGMSNVTTVTNKLRHVEACIRYSLDSFTEWAATALINPDTSIRWCCASTKVDGLYHRGSRSKIRIKKTFNPSHLVGLIVLFHR